MQLAICSYSFNRLLKRGEQDIFGYITTCRELGCTQLDPWLGHLEPLREGDRTGREDLSEDDRRYIDAVAQAAVDAGLPMGCIAVDGAHIYEDEPAKREANRRMARRWLAIAAGLGATRVRIDAGGPEEMPDDVFEVIKAGYGELIEVAAKDGVAVLTENHWGPSRHPANVVRLLDEIPGLELLFDSYNWAPGKQGDGWLSCASRASSTHIKTFHFTADGQELTQNIPAVIDLLLDAGYAGPWGVESVPRAVDEIEGARRTIALIRKCVEGREAMAARSA
ncbi:MAG: TIM barrel protein [Phycisphaeraceae bacterium]